MRTILSSIIENKSTEVLSNLLSDTSLLSSQEISYLTFIKDSYDNSGTFPSVDLLSNQFIELSFKDSLGNYYPTLSLSDLQVYISNFLTQRQHLQQSQLMMKMATKVSQEGLTDEVIESLRSLIPQSSGTHNTIASPETFITYYQNKKDKPQGIVTNIKAIDTSLGGIPYGAILTLFGFVASYKSLLANNIAYHNALNLKYNVCILSLEVSKEQVLSNLLSRHSASLSPANYLSATDIYKSALSEEQESLLFNQVLPDFYNYQDHGKITILDETDFTTFSPAEIRQKLYEVDDLCLAQTGYPLDCIIVDHINLCKFSGSSSRLSVNEEGNQYVSFFHKLVLNFRKGTDSEGLTTTRQLIGILLAQANRTGWKKAVKNKGKYSMDAISEFNELERSSQYIMSVFTSEEMKLAKEATVQLLKNRSGPTLEEPVTVYAEPQAYTIGDELQGFNDAIEVSELDSLFSSGGSITDLL